MSIILGILGVLIAIGIVVALIKFVFRIFQYILGVAIVVGVIYGGYRVIKFTILHMGWWIVIIPVALFLVLAIVGGVIQALKPSLEKNVAEVFREIEMGTENDILGKLERKPTHQQLMEILKKYIESGTIEKVDFPNQPALYRWTEDREYARGVVTHHIRMD